MKCVCLVIKEPVYFHGDLLKGPTIERCDKESVNEKDLCAEHLSKHKKAGGNYTT